MRTFKLNVTRADQSLGDALSALSKFPAQNIAEAAWKGAIWLQKGGKGKILRERDATLILRPKDLVTFYLDPKVLSLPELKHAACLEETRHYGVWIKQAGVVSQGTQTGDHTSLLRYVELTKKKETFLVHRLDRETEGLTIIAYTSEGAAKLSALFQENKIVKTYEAVVLGSITPGISRTISAPLDGKEAITHYKVIDSSESKSLLRVEIETGRLHQIRRHLDSTGYPVMGDPKYGKGNKNRKGLQLLASSLSFVDPWDKKQKTWTHPAHLTV